jgi:hypothetical protein
MKTPIILATILVLGTACCVGLRQSTWLENGAVVPSSMNSAFAIDSETEPSNRVRSILEASDCPTPMTNVASTTQDDGISDIRSDDAKLKTLLRQSRRPATFVQPSHDEIERFERLLLATIRQSKSRVELTQAWSVEGWQLHHWEANGDSFLAICEQGKHRRGRGFFAFRVDSESKLVLQAPHRFYDSGSGTIVREIFVEHDCRAAAWNTIHRKQFDLAHRKHHFINAFTRVMIAIEPEPVIAQLHGFANEKQSGSARTAELIVSDATKFPGRLARATTIRLKENFGSEAVRLYPLEVKHLGGTKNQQASVVRSLGCVGFLHLELNKDLREKLLKSFQLRSAFYKSLAGPS